MVHSGADPRLHGVSLRELSEGVRPPAAAFAFGRGARKHEAVGELAAIVGECTSASAGPLTRMTLRVGAAGVRKLCWPEAAGCCQAARGPFPLAAGGR